VTNIHPFSFTGLSGELPRGKIDMEILEEVKAEVGLLAAQGAAETDIRGSGYPHYYSLQEAPTPPHHVPDVISSAITTADLSTTHNGAALVVTPESGLLLVSGERATSSLAQICTSDVAALRPGGCQGAFLLDSNGYLIDNVMIVRLEEDPPGRDRYLLRTHAVNHARVAAWLRALGDGYTIFDNDELYAKIEGPLVVEDLSQSSAEVKSSVDLEGQSLAAILHGLETTTWHGPDYSTFSGYGSGSGRPTGLELHRSYGPEFFELRKPYFVGHRTLDPVRERPDLPSFRWEEPSGVGLRRTPLYEWHRAHTNRIIPFAGWEMPVWYTGVLDEHNAIRRAAGLFDVAHMGVFEIRGPHAAEFLDLVCTNYVRWYAPGESFYSYFLDPDGNVIDDLLIYRRAPDRFLMVVNASNADKDWAWINAVNNAEVLIDRERPGVRVLRPAELRDLKDPSVGADMRVDLALQGPAALRTLQSLTDDPRLRDRLGRLRKTGVLECNLQGLDLVIARTGYTGEEIGYEIFVHPEQAVTLWESLLKAGSLLGVQPAGLAARDSTRTEAGLPLYGHELAGPFAISPAGAGFAAYVKLHKPYFIGRSAHMAREQTRAMEIVRFRMNGRGVRMPKTGDPVTNDRGQAVGWVTSAAVDVDGVILGLAYIQSRYARPGDGLGIINLPAKPLLEKANKAELEPGDKVLLPDAATLLGRFPDTAERGRWRQSR
jgi:glycine hydroxymethyltransferase